VGNRRFPQYGVPQLPQNRMAKRSVRISSLKYHYAVRHSGLASNCVAESPESRKNTAVLRAKLKLRFVNFYEIELGLC
jgi:hypothetical protein